MSNFPTWHEYVLFTDETASYPCSEIRCGDVPDYPWHGLREEYGEVHGAFKRRLRDDGERWTKDRLAKLRSEIGDMLWYCARFVQHLDMLDEYEGSGFLAAQSYGDGFGTRQWWGYFEAAISNDDIDGVLTYLQELATEFNWRLDEIAAENMAKLRDRKARGVIQGKGGDR